MQTYKIVVAYDGTDFHGLQQQPKDITIHSCLTRAFQKAFNLSANILAASRTDSGVHALGQVARVKTKLNITPEKLKTVWNRALPKSVLIRDVQKSEETFNVIGNNFHPFHNVDHKIYYYHLFLKPPLPFFARFGWYYKFIEDVDFKKLENALQLYVGEHDFASFCKLDKDEKKPTTRRLDKITVKKINRFNMLRIEIKGKSFLRYQIRRMVGYALDVARQPTLSLDYLENMLKNPNPKQVLLKADACGLCLRKVVYKNELNFKKRKL